MNRLTLVTAVLAVTVVSGCGSPPPPVASDTPLEHAARHLDASYRCPMHPEITSDEPGTCPICGMDLVPVYADGNDAEAAVIELSPTMVNNLGVRTAPARRGRLDATVETVGTVAWDDRGVVEVRVRAEGYVERLTVRAEGERVRRGEPLFAVFSPRLAAAQREYLHAASLGDTALLAASAARLEALGLGAAAIRALEAGGESSQRVTYFAPVDGVVRALGVREGALIDPAMSAVTLAPVTRLWVVADVPEADAARIAVGAPATITFAALPGERYAARALEVLPALATATRTLQVRFAIDNPGGILAAGMLADVVIESPAGPESVLVPAEALIRTGRAERVIVALGEGRFSAREVVAGRAGATEVEIHAGIEPGEQVVVSGQFMIDSESQVRGSLRRFDEPDVSGASAPDRPGDARQGQHGEHGS